MENSVSLSNGTPAYLKALSNAQALPVNIEGSNTSLSAKVPAPSTEKPENNTALIIAIAVVVILAGGIYYYNYVFIPDQESDEKNNANNVAQTAPENPIDINP